MRLMARVLWIFVFVLPVLSAILVGEARADTVLPLTIPAGIQVLTAQPGATVQVTLPAGFFGTQGGNSSDPFTDLIVNLFGTGGSSEPETGLLIEQVSLSFNKIDVHYKEQGTSGDTKVKTGSTTLNNLGDMDTIPIEIVSLSLTSTNPITVTYGGSFDSFFDVFVTLSPVCQQQQSPGSMTVTRTSDLGGTFTATIPVCPRLTFQQHGCPSCTQFVIDLNPDTFTGQGTFTVVPEPGSLSLLVLGLGAVAVRRRGASEK